MSAIVSAAIFLSAVTLAYGVPIVLTWTGRGPGFMRELGFLAGAQGNVQAWSMAAAVVIAYSAFSLAAVPLVAAYVVRISWLKGIAFLAALAAGVFEEALFRRCIMDGLAARRHGAFVQVAVSGLVFGLAHAAWGLFGGHAQAAISAAAATTLLGLALGCVYILGNRSLAPCVAAHFIIDALIEPGLVLSAFTGFGRLPR